MRPRHTQRGFTLVELLVVIAIIGILAGFIATSLPGVLRRAKITSTKNTMTQLRTTLVTYFTENNTYPPAYGYLSPLFLKAPKYANPSDRPGLIATDLGDTTITERDAYFLVPWMSSFREHGNQKLYDPWTRGNGYDTDGDGELSRLEFAPIGNFNKVTQHYSFNFTNAYQPPPSGTNDAETMTDLDRQLADQGPRAFIYVPVSIRQARLFRRIIAENSASADDPRPFNLNDAAIEAIYNQLTFPPPAYDAFVLVSVGPNFDSGTNGIIVDWERMGLDNFVAKGQEYAFYATINQYHLVALATYFMATRDADNNNELDFDYEARASRGEGKNMTNNMPGKNPRGDGPLIYSYGN